MADAVKVVDRIPLPAVRQDRGAPAVQPVLDDEDLLPARVAFAGTSRRILISALRLFAERGYHAVPVREIARGAGVRASSMYEYRASKEDLLRDLMLIGHEEHSAWLEEAVAGADGVGPREALRRLVRAHVLLHATYPMLARVCNRELSALSPDSLDAVLAVRRASEDLIQRTIEEGMEGGEFRPADTWLATAAIGAMGIRVAEWFGPNAGFSADQVADTYADFALRLLAA